MFTVLRHTIREYSNDNCSRMAAALAYYTAFSLAPLLIIVITICGLIWDPADVQGVVESELQEVVGKDGAQQVHTMLANATKFDRGIIASFLSGLMLLVGATSLVGQLQAALNDAWEVQPDPDQGGIKNFISKRILSLGMICGIAFLLLVSLVLSSLLSASGDVIANILPAGVSEAMLHILNAMISIIIIAMLFAFMFKFLPDAKIVWSDVTLGAILTAILFVIGKYAMGAYLGSKNMESTFGAAGSLALILLWVYYSSMIFLVGAEFTQVWAKTRGSGVVPEKGAVRVVEMTEKIGQNTDGEPS